MSWRYLPVLEAEYSQADCSAGELSRPLNTTTTANESCSNANATECSNRSRSGMTLEHLTAMNGVVESMWLPEAFLASLSALPENKEGGATLEICGQTRRGYLAKYDRDGRCWRTSQRCLLSDTLEPFSEIWPRWGLLLDGECSRRVPLVPHIHARGCSLLPTPTVSQLQHPGATKHIQGNQISTVQALAARDKWGVGGQYNPSHAAWLMGWPESWTNLSQLAMDGFRLWLFVHGVSLQNQSLTKSA